MRHTAPSAPTQPTLWHRLPPAQVAGNQRQIHGAYSVCQCAVHDCGATKGKRCGAQGHVGYNIISTSLFSKTMFRLAWRVLPFVSSRAVHCKAKWRQICRGVWKTSCGNHQMGRWVGVAVIAAFRHTFGAVAHTRGVCRLTYGMIPLFCKHSTPQCVVMKAGEHPGSAVARARARARAKARGR